MARISNNLQAAEDAGYEVKVARFASVEAARTWAQVNIDGDYDIKVSDIEGDYEVRWAERDGVAYISGPSFAEQHRQRLAFHRFVTY